VITDSLSVTNTQANTHNVQLSEAATQVAAVHGTVLVTNQFILKWNGSIIQAELPVLLPA
jgi:hypothetical protein